MPTTQLDTFTGEDIDISGMAYAGEKEYAVE
jgi:hypothetical protein